MNLNHLHPFLYTYSKTFTDIGQILNLTTYLYRFYVQKIFLRYLAHSTVELLGLDNRDARTSQSYLKYFVGFEAKFITFTRIEILELFFTLKM